MRVERHEKIPEVRQRVADRAHLPVQDPEDAGIRLVEDHVVDLIVAVDQCRAMPWLEILVREEMQYLIEVRDLAYGLLGLDVDGLRLGGAYLLPRRQLAVVEPVAFAEGFEPGFPKVDAVEPG